jgi:multidrug transporter EmrE-like cation transporter
MYCACAINVEALEISFLNLVCFSQKLVSERLKFSNVYVCYVNLSSSEKQCCPVSVAFIFVFCGLCPATTRFISKLTSQSAVTFRFILLLYILLHSS